MKYKPYLIGMLVIRLITFAASLFLWIGGLSYFLEKGGFISWVLWGAFCLLAMPIEFLKNIISGVKDGARDGANHYVVKDYGSFYTASNKTFSGAVSGFFISILAFLLVGPIITPLKVIGNLATVIHCIINLRALNKNEGEH